MLEYGAKTKDPIVSFDGRQSEVAAELQRGVCRALRALGHCVVTELPLANGRRADVVAMSGRSDILIVEVKSCLLDYRTDAKWQDYLEYCDRLYCAVRADSLARSSRKRLGSSSPIAMARNSCGKGLRSGCRPHAAKP